MTFQTTFGWSLVTSAVVTFLLALVPGDSVWWGLLMLLAGVAILYYRDDRRL